MMTLLPPPMCEAGERGLVGHAAREAERVDERVLVGLVREEATAAERGTEPRVVDGDDGLEAGVLVWQKTTCSWPDWAMLSKIMWRLRWQALAARMRRGGLAPRHQPIHEECAPMD